MSRLTLTEYLTTERVRLSVRQRAQLAALLPSVLVSPSAGEVDLFDLKPSSVVGVLTIDGLDIIVQPKMPLDRLLFVLSYSMGRVKDVAIDAELTGAGDLVEAIVPAFVHHVRRAIARGVQQGYRTVDESSLTLRGRLRIGDQILRRFGPMPPAEITYDDFTVDIELNRIVRAATQRLLRLRLRSTASRAALRAIDARLDAVSLEAYDPRRLPLVTFNRLNERYRPAVGLAKLILRSTSFDLGHGGVPASAFLVDMNRAFEDFVVEALREALGPLDGELVQGNRRHALFLDEGERIGLRPDLSIWQHGACRFVGDVKYKRVVSEDYANADIYQVVSYAIATGLDKAMLIYASWEGPPALHRIVHIGRDIELVALDLTEPPAGLLTQIGAIAERIRGSLRAEMAA